METRSLGKTNLNIGILGLGTEYLAKQDPSTIRSTLQAAFAADVNYFDLVFAYTDFLKIFGEEVRKSKKEVLVGCHIGCGLQEGKHKRIRKPAAAEKAFYETLTALQMDSIEIGIIQFVVAREYEKIMQPGQLYDLAVRLQKEGKIKHIGISVHDPEIAKKAIDGGKFEVILTQVNLFAEGMPERLNIFAAAEKANIGLIAVKPLAGGTLLNPGKKIKVPNYKRGGDGIELKMPDNITLPRCLSYVLDTPGVSCVIPGAKNLDELQQNLAVLEASKKERDYSELIKIFKELN
jgi:predicted aldo/keto reductase-like oxidoreductase